MIGELADNLSEGEAGIEAYRHVVDDLGAGEDDTDDRCEDCSGYGCCCDDCLDFDDDYDEDDCDDYDYDEDEDEDEDEDFEDDPWCFVDGEDDFDDIDTEWEWEEI